MEDFEYLGKLTAEKLSKLAPEGEAAEWLKPFDYEKIFAPKSSEELRRVVGGEVPVGSSEADDAFMDNLRGKETEISPAQVAGVSSDDLSIDDLI
jgi:hypothetical protein